MSKPTIAELQAELRAMQATETNLRAALAKAERRLCGAGPDEPVFTLRATDPRAPAVIRYWSHLYLCAKVNNVPPPGPGTDPDDLATFNTERDRRLAKAGEALEIAGVMETWRVQQGG